ncbi:MAG: hypothetical protein KDC54_03150 [Lewinella sp.]|nr:hypothetical protein [Lewinella sp.]
MIKAENPSDNASTSFSLLDVLRTLFRWKKVIIGATAIAALGSVIIVLLLPEYYQSSTIFYAASPDQANPELLFGDGNVAPEFFGNEDDIDRLLTIAESGELIDYLVDSFDLYSVYDIDPDSPRGKHYVRKTFLGHYEVQKTKRDALTLSVEDKSPERAAAMAIAAREKINELGQGLIRDNHRRAIATFERDIEAKETQVSALSDSLRRLREDYGIYNADSQSEGLAEQEARTKNQLTNARARLEAYQRLGGRYRDSVAILEVKIAGMEQQLTAMGEEMNRFNEGVGQAILYNRQHIEATISLSEDKEKLKQYYATTNTDISAIILVEDAEVPLIKSRPFRSLIVVLSVLITFFFTAIGVLLFENYRDIDWRSIYHGE